MKRRAKRAIWAIVGENEGAREETGENHGEARGRALDRGGGRRSEYVLLYELSVILALSA